MLDKNKMDALKNKVATANRIIASQQIDEYLGHVSLRIPGTDKMLIKSFVLNLKQTQGKDIVAVDFDGNQLDGDRRAPVESCLHYEIYKARDDVASVVHSHPKWSIVFGIAGRRILPVYHPGNAYVAMDEIPIHEGGHLILKSDQARSVVETLGNHCACHLRNHGIVVVGTSIEEAVLRAINLERQAELNYLALQLGDVKAIPREVLLDFQQWQAQWVKKTGRSDDVTGWEYFSSTV
jgi:L-ribulose-5-phosphate 4-epimerase